MTKEQTQNQDKNENETEKVETTYKDNIYGASNNEDTKKEIKEKNPEKKRIIKIISLCAIVSLIFGFGGGAMALKFLGNEGSLFQTVASPISSSDGEGTTAENVASVCADSVVEIKTETATYNKFMSEMVVEGAGSGVVIREDGYIVTNNHVVEGANVVTVTTKNGESYVGIVVGTSAQNDLAVIKINEENLTPAVMADSEEINLGEQAIAIGNPLGELGGSVTSGIISALEREIEIEGETMTLLQTDAAINPGNSGGGLFYENGELIGIVVAKTSGTEIEGLAFAIPIDTVKEVATGIIEGEPITQGAYLGVGMVDIKSFEEANDFGVDSPGVYVASVAEGAGAEKGGIKEGDRIVSIDGEAINTGEDVQSVISQKEVGDNVEIRIMRNGKEAEITAKLGEK